MGNASSKYSLYLSKIVGRRVLAGLGLALSIGLIHYRQRDGEELDALKRTMSELTQERDKASEETKEKSAALAAKQRERDALSRRMEELNKALKVLKDQNGELNRRLGQSQGQMDGLKQQLGRRETETKIIANELAQIKVKHSQTIDLLDVRTSELRGAQAFLTKADSMSGADVVRMVGSLDAEILQTAAFMADHFVFEERHDVTEEVQKAIVRLGGSLGPKIMGLLGQTEHVDDPTLIQLACQATTTAYCRRIIMSWHFGDPNYDQFLRNIFTTVQKAEHQAISGRWRALTRTHVRNMVYGDADVSLNLVPHLADTLVDVLLVAGLKANREQIYEEVITTFGEKLRIVVQAALALNWAIGKEITSANLEPIMVSWETVFDSAVMEDINDEEGLKGSVEHVLCTTDLGLQRVVRSSKEGEPERQTSMLLKPKVALESMIEGLQEERITVKVQELAPTRNGQWTDLG